MSKEIQARGLTIIVLSASTGTVLNVFVDTIYTPGFNINIKRNTILIDSTGLTGYFSLELNNKFSFFKL